MKNHSKPSLSRRQALYLLISTTVFGLPTRPALADGKPIDISAHLGKVVLVDFWASWCGPCRQSFPWLNQISKKYSAQGLQVIGVNLDVSAADANKFLSEIPANFDIIYDPDGAYASYYQLETMPSSLLFGRSGELLSRHNGFLSDETTQYETKIRYALDT